MSRDQARGERYQRLSQALRSAGLKVTPQRLGVCEALAATPGHPTAYEVFERVRGVQPGISLATVYNTMRTLQGLGLISEVGSTSDGALHYELNPEPHLNLVCLGCNRIVDVPGLPLEGLLQEVGQRGYEVVDTRLVVYGYCEDCRGKQGRQPE